MRRVSTANVYALDENTGNLLWKFETESPIVSTPAISGKYLYTVCDNGNLYKLDLDTGEKISSVAIGFTVYGSPYASGDMVYVYARDHNVYAVDTVKNTVVWKFSSF